MHRHAVRLTATTFLAALLGLTVASCGDDASGTAATTTTVPVSFCDAASAFATAQLGGPDAATPDAVRATVTAMADAAQALAATAPAADAAATGQFAAAVASLADYASAAGYDVDLGGSAAEWQSEPGASVIAAISSSIGAVDAAVQNECGHYLSDPG